ncbi:PRKG2, partial [Symbiodinium sp. KB8]
GRRASQRCANSSVLRCGEHRGFPRAIPGSGSRRSSRERQATPFVKEEDVPGNVHIVQFSGALASEA